MQRLTLTAPIVPYSSYGILAIRYARAIEHITGAYVSIRAISVSEAFGCNVPPDIRQRFVQGPQPEEWELLMHPPNSFCPTPGKKTAMLTMWEATRLPPYGVEFLNKADLVIVPTSWNASCFSACGVETEIRTMPLGVDPELFQWRPYPAGLNDLVVFGAAGRMAHGGVRKGINEVIQAFQKAFPTAKDVRLHVKAFPDCPVTQVDDPRIVVTRAHLSDAQLASWLQNIHVFVSAARAEGWGLFQHEAMALGRAVMTVNFGGVREFFRPDLGYEVEYRLKPAKLAYEGCGHWAEPDEDSMIDQMRNVYLDRTGAIAKGARAAAHIAPLTWDNSGARLVAMLRECGAL